MKVVGSKERTSALIEFLEQKPCPQEGSYEEDTREVVSQGDYIINTHKANIVWWKKCIRMLEFTPQ